MANSVDWLELSLTRPEESFTDYYVSGVDPASIKMKPLEDYTSDPQIQKVFQKDGKFDSEGFKSMYDTMTVSANEYKKSQFRLEDTVPDWFVGEGTFANNDPRMVKMDKMYKYSDIATDPTRNLMRARGQVYGLSGMNKWTKPVISDEEIAQTRPVRDHITGKQLDYTPEDVGGITGFFKEPHVRGQYDKDETDQYGIIHKKGELKYDEEGLPYYEKLAGRDPANKQILKKWNTLTKEDSFWNKIDVFDSDGLDKHIMGTITKSALKIAPMFIPYVGTAVTAASVVTSLADVWGIVENGIDAWFGTKSPGSDINKGGKWRAYSQQLSLNNTSEYAQQKMFSLENIMNIATDSVYQLKSQRWIASMPAKQRMIWLNNKASKDGIPLATLIKQSFGKLDDVATRKIMQEARMAPYISNINTWQKGSSYFGTAYMAATSASQIMDSASKNGIDNQHAALLYVGYAAALSALFRTDIGRLAEHGVFGLDDLKIMIDNGIVKQGNTIAKAANFASSTVPSLTEKLTWMRKGGELAKSIFGKTNTESMFNTALRSPMIGTRIVAGAAGESLEEMSENVIQLGLEKMYNGLVSLGGKSVTEQAQFAFDANEFYQNLAASAFGGAIGGGIFKGFDINLYTNLENKDFNQLIFNGYGQKMRDSIHKMVKKNTLPGDKDLSTVKVDGVADLAYQFTDANKNPMSQQDWIAKKLIQIIDNTEAIMMANGVRPIEDMAGDKNNLYLNMISTKSDTLFEDKVTATIEELIKVENNLKALNEKKRNKEEVSEADITSLELQKQQLRERYNYYNSLESGEEFFKEGLFNTSPFIKKAFGVKDISDFTDGKDMSELSPEEVKAAREKYENYRKTTMKDDTIIAMSDYERVSDQLQQADFGQSLINYKKSLKSLFNNPLFATVPLYHSESDTLSREYKELLTSDNIIKSMNNIVTSLTSGEIEYLPLYFRDKIRDTWNDLNRKLYSSIIRNAVEDGTEIDINIRTGQLISVDQDAPIEVEEQFNAEKPYLKLGLNENDVNIIRNSKDVFAKLKALSNIIIPDEIIQAKKIYKEAIANGEDPQSSLYHYYDVVDAYLGSDIWMESKGMYSLLDPDNDQMSFYGLNIPAKEDISLDIVNSVDNIENILPKIAVSPFDIIMDNPNDPDDRTTDFIVKEWNRLKTEGIDRYIGYGDQFNSTIDKHLKKVDKELALYTAMLHANPLINQYRKTYAQYIPEKYKDKIYYELVSPEESELEHKNFSLLDIVDGKNVKTFENVDKDFSSLFWDINIASNRLSHLKAISNFNSSDLSQKLLKETSINIAGRADVLKNIQQLYGGKVPLQSLTNFNIEDKDNLNVIISAIEKEGIVPRDTEVTNKALAELIEIENEIYKEFQTLSEENQNKTLDLLLDSFCQKEGNDRLSSLSNVLSSSDFKYGPARRALYITKLLGMDKADFYLNYAGYTNGNIGSNLEEMNYAPFFGQEEVVETYYLANYGTSIVKERYLNLICNLYELDRNNVSFNSITVTGAGGSGKTASGFAMISKMLNSKTENLKVIAIGKNEDQTKNLEKVANTNNINLYDKEDADQIKTFDLLISHIFDLLGDNDHKILNSVLEQEAEVNIKPKILQLLVDNKIIELVDNKYKLTKSSEDALKNIFTDTVIILDEFTWNDFRPAILLDIITDAAKNTYSTHVNAYVQMGDPYQMGNVITDSKGTVLYNATDVINIASPRLTTPLRSGINLLTDVQSAIVNITSMLKNVPDKDANSDLVIRNATQEISTKYVYDPNNKISAGIKFQNDNNNLSFIANNITKEDFEKPVDEIKPKIVYITDSINKKGDQYDTSITENIIKSLEKAIIDQFNDPSLDVSNVSKLIVFKTPFSIQGGEYDNVILDASLKKENLGTYPLRRIYEFYNTMFSRPKKAMLIVNTNFNGNHNLKHDSNVITFSNSPTDKFFEVLNLNERKDDVTKESLVNKFKKDKLDMVRTIISHLKAEPGTVVSKIENAASGNSIYDPEKTIINRTVILNAGKQTYVYPEQEPLPNINIKTEHDKILTYNFYISNKDIHQITSKFGYDGEQSEKAIYNIKRYLFGLENNLSVSAINTIDKKYRNDIANNVHFYLELKNADESDLAEGKYSKDDKVYKRAVLEEGNAVLKLMVRIGDENDADSLVLTMGVVGDINKFSISNYRGTGFIKDMLEQFNKNKQRPIISNVVDGLNNFRNYVLQSKNIWKPRIVKYDDGETRTLKSLRDVYGDAVYISDPYVVVQDLLSDLQPKEFTETFNNLLGKSISFVSTDSDLMSRLSPDKMMALYLEQLQAYSNFDGTPKLNNDGTSVTEPKQIKLEIDGKMEYVTISPKFIQIIPIFTENREFSDLIMDFRSIHTSDFSNAEHREVLDNLMSVQSKNYLFRALSKVNDYLNSVGSQTKDTLQHELRWYTSLSQLVDPNSFIDNITKVFSESDMYKSKDLIPEQVIKNIDKLKFEVDVKTKSKQDIDYYKVILQLKQIIDSTGNKEEMALVKINNLINNIDTSAFVESLLSYKERLAIRAKEYFIEILESKGIEVDYMKADIQPFNFTDITDIQSLKDKIFEPIFNNNENFKNIVTGAYNMRDQRMQDKVDTSLSVDELKQTFNDKFVRINTINLLKNFSDMASIKSVEYLLKKLSTDEKIPDNFKLEYVTESGEKRKTLKNGKIQINLGLLGTNVDKNSQFRIASAGSGNLLTNVASINFPATLINVGKNMSTGEFYLGNPSVHDPVKPIIVPDSTSSTKPVSNEVIESIVPESTTKEQSVNDQGDLSVKTEIDSNTETGDEISQSDSNDQISEGDKDVSTEETNLDVSIAQQVDQVIESYGIMPEEDSDSITTDLSTTTIDSTSPDQSNALNSLFNFMPESDPNSQPEINC